MPDKLLLEGHADEDIESCADEGTVQIRTSEQKIICTYSFTPEPNSEPVEGAVFTFKDGTLKRHAFRGTNIDVAAFGSPTLYEDLPEGGFEGICGIFRKYADTFEVPVTET